MSIKINSFGGPIVWFLRKHYSKYTSHIMLSLVARIYFGDIIRYIDWFMSQEKVPVFHNVVIETINRCNGKCEFCPANAKDESRPFKKMPEDMFRDIVKQLKEMDWSGKIFMCVNNEPFIDHRILEFSRYIKQQLRGTEIAIITNGTLLSKDKMDEMADIVDYLTINDYSEKYELSEKIKEIYCYVRKNYRKFAGMRIVINRRYSKEILATRAGTAPNKPRKTLEIKSPCINPFTDLVIFPDGQVGMCCNDCKEVTNFGNVGKDSLREIWQNKKFYELRKAMCGGDRNYPFCKECDVLDAGEREKFIKLFLSEK